MTTEQPTRAIRPPGCPAFDPIRHDGSFGWCHAVEHRVYLAAGNRCLCDHCSAAPDGTRVISKDVIFVGNDLVELKSDRAAKLATATEQAATMQCAPKAPPKPVTATKPKAGSTPAKPKPKGGLLAFS